MSGLSAVAIETEASRGAVARASLAFVSARQWSTKTSLTDASSRMDSSRSAAIMGSMTLRSSWPHWPPVRPAAAAGRGGRAGPGAGRGHHRDGLADDGVDLAGHDAGAGLDGRQLQLAQ